jgi:peptidoglycan hydrolase-like protein with peptidoglycan-binding domain
LPFAHPINGKKEITMKLRALVIALFAISSTAAMANISSSLNDTSNVRELQQTLNDKGFDAGPVDGKAGRQTKAAIKKLQQAQGLTASGKLDQQTLAALSVSTSASTSDTSTPSATQEMKDQPSSSTSSSTPQQPSTK